MRRRALTYPRQTAHEKNPKRIAPPGLTFCEKYICWLGTEHARTLAGHKITVNFFLEVGRFLSRHHAKRNYVIQPQPPDFGVDASGRPVVQQTQVAGAYAVQIVPD